MPKQSSAQNARITQIRVNGRPYKIDADPETSLLTVLRDQLDLTGSKYGCGEGQCGACTVLIGGNPRHSCVTPVGAAAARFALLSEGGFRDEKHSDARAENFDEVAALNFEMVQRRGLQLVTFGLDLDRRRESGHGYAVRTHRAPPFGEAAAGACAPLIA